MRRAVVTGVVLLAFALGILGVAIADVMEVDVKFSPKVLKPTSMGTWVTLHVGIPYSSVEGYLVEVDGVEVPVARDKADLLGDLVVKLRRTDVAAVASPGTVTVLIAGVTTDGSDFVGAGTLRVKADQQTGTQQTKGKKRSRNGKG